MTEEKKFKIIISVQPDIEVTIESKDPCDCLAISGALIMQMRLMKLEPRSKVLGNA